MHETLNTKHFSIFETGSHFVAQASLKLLGSSNSSASTSQVARTKVGTTMPSRVFCYFYILPSGFLQKT
jgi:hypothetical protein